MLTLSRGLNEPIVLPNSYGIRKPPRPEGPLPDLAQTFANAPS